MSVELTSEQQTAVEERRQQLGDKGLARVTDEWTALIPGLQQAKAKDADPTSPEVQELIRRFQALINEFTGGDPAVRDRLQRQYESKGPHIETAAATPQMQERARRWSNEFLPRFGGESGRDEFWSLLSYVQRGVTAQEQQHA